MGNFFSKNNEPIPVVAMGLDCAGVTTSLYQLRKLGFTEGDVTTVIPTLGFHQEIVTLKKIGNFAPLNITSWEVGGGIRIEPLWVSYFAKTRAMIFMVDSKRIAMLGTPKCDHCRGKYCTKTEYATDRRLLDRSQCQNDARYWLWHMLYLRQNLLYRLDVRKPNNWKQRYKGIADFPGLPEDAPLLVFANKQDLSGALSADQVAEQLGLQSTRTEFDVNGLLQRIEKINGDFKAEYEDVESILRRTSTGAVKRGEMYRKLPAVQCGSSSAKQLAPNIHLVS